MYGWHMMAGENTAGGLVDMNKHVKTPRVGRALACPPPWFVVRARRRLAKAQGDAGYECMLRNIYNKVRVYLS